MGDRLHSSSGTGRADWAVRRVPVGLARPRAVPPPANDNRPPLAVRLRMAAGIAAIAGLIAGIVILAL